MQKRHPGEGGAVLLGGEHVLSTENHPEPQPDSICKLQALHLIAHCHVTLAHINGHEYVGGPGQ